MPKAAPLQSSFNAGEISPLVESRIEFSKRESGVSLLQNYVPTVQGPAIRRPGTYHVAEVKNSAQAARLLPFQFSTEQAYIIELGDVYARFYRDQGQIESGGSPYEIVSPFAVADIFNIQYTQSADVLFMVHEDYAPRELTRTGHTSWSFSSTSFSDGPYLTQNITATTLVASAATGSVTLTASGVTGINNDTGFQATDVGRSVRILSGGAWAWGTITAHTSTTVVTVSVQSGNFPTGSGVATWRLGLWSDTTGYPSAIAFYQDRLFYATGTRLDGSRTGDYSNFAPSDADGTVADDHALSTTINSNTVNIIRWLVGQDKGLLVGTTGGEFLIRPSNQNEALSPTNIKADKAAAHGSAQIQPVLTGSSMLYVQRAKRKLREISYTLEADNYKAYDMTKLASHITASGFKELAFQQEPHSIVFAARQDGLLLGFTYDRDEEAWGWHRHPVGGVADASDNPAEVESIAVIPATDGSYDELWLLVKRYINGATVRYVEYMQPYRETTDAQEDAFFVDSGLTYDGAATTTVSGLDHLEGETLTILADGAYHPPATVTGGQITLNSAASKIHAGLGYNSDMWTLSIEAGSADGTPVGKTKRVHGVTIRVLDMLGLKLGPNANDLKEHIFRKASDTLGSPPPLFSGDIFVQWGDNYTTQPKVYLRQDGPFPGTISAIAPLLQTVDR